MKLDQSRYDKAAEVINLIGFGICALGVIAMLIYFWSQSEHRLHDVLTWLASTLVIGLLVYGSRRSRDRCRAEACARRR